ncbi:MAG: Prolyl oligopeptidase N-terminal beta-propeller domain [Frankiaceae bacterium]|jgi:dipeptidyl aminopeptidase/acylaminoacyl peptidase|nr:Prolyl oligopeptidase N-terminal beta-propeller domain [Frankiaceae bacterium]
MTLDDRLRAALARRAADARVAPDLYARVLDRRRKRRRALVVLPVTATAAVVALAVAVSATGGDPRRPVASASPARATLAAVLTKTGAYRYDGEAAALRERFDSGSAIAVASGHDGVHYAYGQQGAGCTGSLTLVSFASGTPVARTETTDGAVSDIAFSADGRKVAYVVDTAGHSPTPSCDRPVLHVRDLTTGRERTWDDGLVKDAIVMGGTFIINLSWSPDGRSLAYTAGVCCAHGEAGFFVLDVTQPAPSSYLNVRERGLGTPGNDCYLTAPAYRGTTGTLTAVQVCLGDTRQSALVTVDPSDGHVTEVLTPLPTTELESASVVAWDPSGVRALVVLSGVDRVGRVVEWRAGLGVRAMPGPKALDVSW